MLKPPHILEGESLEEFNALSQSLRAEFEPVTDSEHRIVDLMIQHEWYMRRALRMQQAISASAPEGEEADEKRLKLVVRYHRSHERSFEQAKRELELLRKHKRRMEQLTEKQAALTKNRQRQWEQLLKKMPPLTDWVN